MYDFLVHSRETAPEGSKETLQQTEQAYGFVPNLYGALAESPAAIKAYQAINEGFQKDSGLNATEQQVVLLATSVFNDCEYCVSAHSVVAEKSKVPTDVVEALREGKPIEDAKLEALRKFTESVVDKRGWVNEDDLNAFRDAGYSKKHVLGVLVGVAQKTLSNYTNHIAETPLDKAFEKRAWEKSAAA